MKRTLLITHRCGHCRTYEDDLPASVWDRLEAQLKAQDCMECRSPRTNEARRMREATDGG